MTFQNCAGYFKKFRVSVEASGLAGFSFKYDILFSGTPLLFPYQSGELFVSITFSGMEVFLLLTWDI